MIVLGLETATAACGIGVVDAAHWLAEYRIQRPQVHAELLVPAIERTLQDAGLRLADLAGIAVSQGPGSFTGLRIGMSVGKGLALALGIPLVAVPTLECLAWQARPYGRHVCTAMPAIRGRLYWAVYRAGRPARAAGLRLAGAVRRAEPGAAAADVRTDSVVIGPLDPAQRTTLQVACRGRGVFPDGPVNWPSAVTVAQLGGMRLAAEVPAWAGLEPLYVGDFPDRS